MATRKIKCEMTHPMKHTNVQCDCGKLHLNLFVTETRIYPKKKYVYVNHKAHPFICDGCDTAYKMQTKENLFDEKNIELGLVDSKKIPIFESNNQ